MAEPTHYSFVPWDGYPDLIRSKVRDAAMLQAKNGATFWRYTEVNVRYEPRKPDEELHGIYVEGWDERPKVQPAFNPPLTKDGRDA